jgi:predicted Zn-dependent protease
MKACIAILLSLICLSVFAGPGARPRPAYPESEAEAAWRALAASYVRKAERDRKLDLDAALNARVDTVMSRVGAAVAAVDPAFANSAWRAILIEDFGHGAVAFPGRIVLVDARFVRRLALSDDELALVFAHEAGHILAGHAYEKLSFMAETLGPERAPTARTALLEFLAKDDYAASFRPVARLQEREADRIGAAILHASGYDTERALGLFDKLTTLESHDGSDAHDSAMVRRDAVRAVLANLRR